MSLSTGRSLEVYRPPQDVYLRLQIREDGYYVLLLGLDSRPRPIIELISTIQYL